MKRSLTLLFCIVSLGARGQANLINFDPWGWPDYHNFIAIDTTYHHNIWQVGAPHKTVFNSAYSGPNAIVTDTLNPYSTNDTSVFTLKVPGYYPCFPYSMDEFVFYYQLDIDSGVTAKIEVSDDSGNHWTDLIDSLPQYYHWNGIDTPNLKISTSGWKQFGIARQPYAPAPDTILFRFTFITDSFVSGKDGWIIDDIYMVYAYSHVPQVQNNNLITLYPNPSKGNIYIHSNQQNSESASVSVLNMKGQEVYRSDNLAANGYLNLPLPNGVYTLKYFTHDEYCVKRIVIER